MFYESERIVRKNQKYVKSKAYNFIRDALNRGLTYEEIDFASEMALKQDDFLNETQVDVINLARKIVQLEMEKENEDNSITISSDDNLVQSRVEQS